MQNAAARLVLSLSKYSHISPALYQLHWLPVQHRVHFKILILTFKAIHGLAPKYIIELINIKPRSIYNLRSNQSSLLDPPKGKMLFTLGDKSFSAAAPYLWNSLPSELRDIQSLAIFKCKLKTSRFISCSFYNVTCLTLTLLVLLIKFIIIIINILYYYYYYSQSMSSVSAASGLINS